MKFCEQINNNLVFLPNLVTCCCVCGDLYPPIYARNKEILKYNINFEKKRNFYINMINSGDIIDYRCNNCCYLSEVDEIPQNTKFKYITLHHWEACNCACVYCPYKKTGQAGQPYYNPYLIIKQLYEEDKIDKDNLIVAFQGGDIGVLKNFDDYINLFQENGFLRLDFCTNNIIYQPKIEEVLKANKASLSLSLDCGTKNTYKKIKGVDKFDIYMNNLKRYVDNTVNKKLITVNYIITDKINDNKAEIEKFLKLMYDSGVKRVGVRIDNKYVNEWSHQVEINKYPKGLNELIIHFFKTAQQYGLTINKGSKEQIDAMIKLFKATKKNKKNIFSFWKK